MEQQVKKDSYEKDRTKIRSLLVNGNQHEAKKVLANSDLPLSDFYYIYESVMVRKFQASIASEVPEFKEFLNEQIKNERKAQKKKSKPAKKRIAQIESLSL